MSKKYLEALDIVVMSLEGKARRRDETAIKLTETQYRATAEFQERIARACQQYGKPADAAKATRDAKRNLAKARVTGN